MERLGRVIVRRRVAILVATLIALVVAGAVGGGVISQLSSGGFDDPASESARADDLLERQFGAGQPNVLLLVTARAGGVDDPGVAAEGAAITRQLATEKGVAQAVSYWTLGSPPPLRSEDGKQALVLARLEGTEDEERERIEELSPRYQRLGESVRVEVGGFTEVFRQVGGQVEEDLGRAEIIALPLTLVLLVLVFGSVVAAGLPLGVGAVAIVGTFLVLRVVASITQVSIFALNLTTAMGLALAVDYSLFVVSRFREELRAGRSTDDAVVRTVTTAGRTVVVSALTVAVSLSALLLFPLAFLRSFAYAGMAVVAIAGAASVVSLTALLAILGPKVDRLVLWRRTPAPVGEGFWHRAAIAVMRRPVAIGGGVVALLLLLGAPFLGIRFGLPDDRVLPEEATSRKVHDAIRTNFLSNEADALSVVAPRAAGPAARLPAVDAYAAALSTGDDVARVDAETGTYVAGSLVLPPTPIHARFTRPSATFLSVVPTAEAMSPEGEAVVERVRATEAPFPVLVTGNSAQLVDSKASLFSRMPLAGGLIAVVTFVVLFLMFGSVLVPVKAVVLNLLSLTATFGAMVWVFQDGHLSGLLGFTATGTIDTSTPILMFCIAFGLSMDYEVFLLSRIKEEHDRTGDNVQSVAVGLERTGRIVTAAALLLAVVFAAFATSEVTFIKLFGVGLTLAVLMDATLIRATLVPAFMRLAGKANWWAPPALRRIHSRWGIREVVPDATADGYSEAYKRRLVTEAEACFTDAGIQSLLEEEGVARSDLERWRRELATSASGQS